MQERTIAVKVTGGDRVELNITAKDTQRVIVDVAPALDNETRHILERGLMDVDGCSASRPAVCCVQRDAAGSTSRCGAGASGARRDVSLGLASQISEVTAMLDQISAALGVRRALRRRRRTRKAAQTASCRMPRF